MKRKDAFRKLCAICHRLDEGIGEPYFLPPKLYLFGSTLTDKPDPKDIDLVLVYRLSPAHLKHLSAPDDPGVSLPGTGTVFEVHYEFEVSLRRGMKMIRIELVPNSLEVSLNLPLFVVGEKLRLVWKPDFDWPATLDEIEKQPLPWVGSRELEAKKLVEALKKPPKEVREAKEAQFLAGINAQGQIGLQAARY